MECAALVVIMPLTTEELKKSSNSVQTGKEQQRKEETHNGNEVRLFNWDFFSYKYLLESFIGIPIQIFIFLSVMSHTELQVPVPKIPCKRWESSAKSKIKVVKFRPYIIYPISVLVRRYNKALNDWPHRKKRVLLPHDHQSFGKWALLYGSVLPRGTMRVSCKQNPLPEGNIKGRRETKLNVSLRLVTKCLLAYSLALLWCYSERIVLRIPVACKSRIEKEEGEEGGGLPSSPLPFPPHQLAFF